MTTALPQRIGRWLTTLNAEDVAIGAGLLFFGLLPSGLGPATLYDKLGVGLTWLLGLAIFSGYFVVLASSTDPGERGRQHRSSMVGRAGRAFVAMSPLLGYPLLSLLLRNRDHGEQILLGLLVVLAVPAYLISYTRWAPVLSSRTRRLWLVPLTLLNVWYCYDFLVSAYLLEQPELKRTAVLLETDFFSVAAFGNILSIALRAVILMALPYFVLVFCVRSFAGEHASWRTWLKRYGLFMVCFLLGFLVEAGELRETALFEHHHRFTSFVDAREKPAEVVVLDLRNDGDAGIDPDITVRTLSRKIALFPSLEVLYTPPALVQLPPEVGTLPRLRELHLTPALLKTLPDEVGRLSSLRVLVARNNQLKTLPAQLSALSKLEELDLYGNQLEHIPHVIGSLKSLRRLDLNENPIPREALLGGTKVLLSLPNLEVLNLPFALTSDEETRLRERLAPRGTLVRFGYSAR